MVFDDYGRITSKSWPEFSTSYNYNADALLETVTSDNGTSIAYTYDIYDRLKTEKETGADGLWLEKGYTYKTDGNLETQTYKIQDGTITSEHYTYNYGELTEIKLNGTTSVFKLTAENALGQPTAVTTGPLVRQYGYSIYGIPTGRTAGSWQDAGYNFETATGNLLSRTDKTRSKTESFGYDQLNRLTDYGSYTANYDAKGNLTGKTDVGTFYYTNSSKPYALSGADLASNAVPLRNQNITYSSFEQPLNIAENGYMAGFTYNAEGQRVKMELQQNGIVHLVRHYLGACYEKDLGVGGTKEKLYLGGDAYSAPAVYVKQGSGSWQLYYICRDYLGSITHLANSSGSLIQELSYDAWGRLRNPATQTAYAPGSEPELFLGRGYTGHEHLAWFGLVNMNGRLYDPAVGRFLSPDIHVQEPDNSQSFNRYGYCLNNPLKYIDPSGYTWLSQLGKWISKNGNQIITIAATVVVVAAVTVATAGMGTLAAGAIIGAAGGFTSGAVGTWLSGGSFWGGVGSGLINGAVGAVAGMAGGVAAQWASKSIGSFAINGLQVSGKSAIGGFVSGAVGGTAGGAAGGFATGLLMTGDIDEAFKMAGQGAIYGGIAGGALGAYRGFRDAKALGNNPWTGKQNKVEITKSKFGHTFDNHGESATEFVTKRASGSGSPQGQFLDDQAAAKFINENLGRTANGAVDIPMPKGFPARVINPNGTISTPTHIRLVPGGNGVKTAYPLTKF
jgi:RHS repeat-associated protein